MKSRLIGKDSDAGRDWGQEEKGTTEDEMAGWHHRLDGHELVMDRQAWHAAVHGTYIIISILLWFNIKSTTKDKERHYIDKGISTR